jgi:hypothetical protein
MYFTYKIVSNVHYLNENTPNNHDAKRDHHASVVEVCQTKGYGFIDHCAFIHRALPTYNSITLFIRQAGHNWRGKDQIFHGNDQTTNPHQEIPAHI